MVAGYAVYGPQTMLVLTIGNGVVGFTLDREMGSWVLTHENIRVPEDTKEFAINMSNMRHWAPPVKRYIDDCLAGATGPLGKDYNMRWIASMAVSYTHLDVSKRPRMPCAGGFSSLISRMRRSSVLGDTVLLLGFPPPGCIPGCSSS